ncbi:MAG TPA: 5-formyltetrahydrofolate cyclo-ligase [Sphingomonas sp.]|jgi:5-formyltetrahydrofolate cyclo-ligase|uniref:5-formyltetrahydrofolate cyclo-ligase n=1 Tax=Sphingomonas sp. TaxID=28214 RepID=UPI002ED975D1
MDKPALRSTLRAARARFVADEGVAAQRLVATLQLTEHAVPHLAGATIVSGYVSDGEEVDPLPLLFRAIDRGCDVALPRITGRDRPMVFHRWLPGDDLVPGPLGLLQPRVDADIVDPDLILTPLLGFDAALNRLGQGAGFYDRAFAERPAARRIGLAWSVQAVDALPIDPWDIPLHGVATELGWITA